MAKKNPWKDDLYGTYSGPRQSIRDWRKAFSERMDMSPEEAEEIIREDSPWTILEVMADATVDEIRSAYRKLIIQYHPDKYPEEKKSWASEKFIRIEAAYTLLMKRGR